MNIEQIKCDAIKQSKHLFEAIDDIVAYNTHKVLEAFRTCRISEAHFKLSSGYGYDDIGRKKLDELYAIVLGAEKALVRTQFVSGTHALATVLFGLLRPNDELIAITGAPYDTLQTVIGHGKNIDGSLTEFGVKYKELPLSNGIVDEENFVNAISLNTSMALIQRSKGYDSKRPSLSIKDIERITHKIKDINPKCICFVDNCYGEFAELQEPTNVPTVDIIAGSLIKNIGGGLAPTGGYIAGKKKFVQQASHRLTAPGIGEEQGATLTDCRLLFQGLFMAPHIVGQALKTAIFTAGIFSRLGYNTYPAYNDPRYDIIQAIELPSADRVIAFCRAIQKYSPIDSFVQPQPWNMPGYSEQVIMAAGTFVQGASIELSADAPMREPYIVYLQGGLTFEHSLIAITNAVNEVMFN